MEHALRDPQAFGAPSSPAGGDRGAVHLGIPGVPRRGPPARRDLTITSGPEALCLTCVLGSSTGIPDPAPRTTAP